MRKPVSRQSFPPPRSGRRIPPIPSTKVDASEDRPNARDLLATVNSASEGAAATWLAFLGTMAYLAVTLGGVTHVDLLLNNDTTLPFVNVKVPLATFFVMAPLAFVLVHFSLLLQHVMLSRKLAAFEERLAKEEPSRDRGTQNIRDELHSFTFTQVASGKPKGAVVDMAQRLVISLTLVVFPMLLLTFFQIGFLAYHSEPITWWHRGMLALDVGVVWCLARHLARVDPASKSRLTDWWHATSRTKWRLIIGWCRMLDRARSALFPPTSPIVSVANPLLAGARRGGAFVIRSIAPTRVVIVALLVFSICVATLPHSPDAWIPLDKWMASPSFLSEPVPFCRPTTRTAANGMKEISTCPKATSATRHAFYPTAYLFEHAVDVTSGKSDSLLGWSRNLIVTDKDLAIADEDKKEDDKKEKRLNLRGRDLRYATLVRSKLRRADFYGAKLGGTRLYETDLNAAIFSTASLQGADLSWAGLQRANLSRAGLQGANLNFARLQGADLTGASPQGANLSRARLQGADLSLVGLQGAGLSRASLRGAKLIGTGLQGADLHGASLQGADLVEAGLQGANLTRAELQGANLSRARLQGADLSWAELQGADLSRARVWKTGAPRTLDLSQLAELDIRALDDLEYEVLTTIALEFEALDKKMAKEGTPGRKQFAKARDSVKAVATQLGSRQGAEANYEWNTENGFKTWCELARRPSPDLAKLSTYLGTLACDDDTDKGYMAERLIYRVLESAPNAFLEAFKGCPAFGQIPADLKLSLERAAQADREKAAKLKPETSASREQPTAPKMPEVCVDKPATTTANPPTKP